MGLAWKTFQGFNGYCPSFRRICLQSNLYTELLKCPFNRKNIKYIYFSVYPMIPYIVSHLQQVWGTIFYMGRFSAPTPKRHKVYSNCKALLTDLYDRAGYMSKNEQKACETKLVKTYFDKHGQKRCVGIRDKLRDSQQLRLTTLESINFVVVIPHQEVITKISKVFFHT